MADCNEKSASDLFPDNGIFQKDKMTDFEKLLFAQRALKDQHALISSLRVELGKCKSLIQEQADMIQKYQSLKKADKDERKEFRSYAYNNSLLIENKRLREKNKKLVADNWHLIYQLRHKK